MTHPESDWMHDIPFSEIRKLFEQVNRRRTEGLPTVAFHVGNPDFDTPTHIKDTAKHALDDGMTAYTSNYGIPELRSALAHKLARDNGTRAALSALCWSGSPARMAAWCSWS